MRAGTANPEFAPQCREQVSRRPSRDEEGVAALRRGGATPARAKVAEETRNELRVGRTWGHTDDSPTGS
jgi:hypothetical protein